VALALSPAAVQDGETCNISSTLYDDAGRVYKQTAGGLAPGFSDSIDNRDIHYDCDSSEALTSTVEYDINGNAVRSIDNAGNKTATEYDALGLPIKTTDALGNATLTQFDAVGKVIAVTVVDGNGKKLQHQRNFYDEQGRLFRHEIANLNENGQAIGDGWLTNTSLFDAGHNIVAAVGEVGLASYSTYNNMGQLTESSSDNGDHSRFAYDQAGHLMSKTVYRRDAAGVEQALTTHYFFDELNRNWATINDRLETAYVLYDSLGHAVFAADANSSQLNVSVRSLDRFDEHQNIAGTTNGYGNSSITAYNALGEVLRVAVAMRRDGLGMNPLDTTQASDGLITQVHRYDNNGRLAYNLDDNGRVTRYEYDAMNRLQKTIFADNTSVAVTEYDNLGRVRSSRDALGTTIANEYDVLGRLTTRQISKAKGVQGGTSESYAYDGMGRMISASDANSVITREYGTVNVMQETVNGRTFTYQFDPLGRQNNVTYPSGMQVTSDYDSNGRLKNLQVNQHLPIASYTYSGQGVLESIDRGQHLLSSYHHAADGRLLGIQHLYTPASGAPQPLEQLGFLYNRAGFKETKRDASYLPVRDDSYTYDSAGRLIDATTNDGVMNRVRNYTIDGVQNRLDVAGSTASVGNYISNIVNQYTSAPLGTHLYDANGNLRGIETTGSKISMNYDYRNLMTEMIDSAGRRTTYTYDVLGRRIGKRVGAQQINYVPCGSNVCELNDGTMKQFVFDGVDSPLAMIQGDHILHYLNDEQGSVISLANDAGQIVEKYAYDDFGLPLNPTTLQPDLSASVVGNPFRYTAREWDAESGLYYYRARYLEPVEGRFTTRDSVNDASGFGNAYQYAGNNPINFSDPSGHLCIRNANARVRPVGRKIKVLTEAQKKLRFPQLSTWTLAQMAAGDESKVWKQLYANKGMSDAANVLKVAIDVVSAAQQKAEQARDQQKRMQESGGTWRPGMEFIMTTDNKNAFAMDGFKMDYCNDDPDAEKFYSTEAERITAEGPVVEPSFGDKLFKAFVLAAAMPLTLAYSLFDTATNAACGDPGAAGILAGGAVIGGPVISGAIGAIGARMAVVESTLPTTLENTLLVRVVDGEFPVARGTNTAGSPGTCWAAAARGNIDAIRYLGELEAGKFPPGLQSQFTGHAINKSTAVWNGARSGTGEIWVTTSQLLDEQLATPMHPLWMRSFHTPQDAVINNVLRYRVQWQITNRDLSFTSIKSLQ
jgi:RHS repeat-associated protein